MQKGASSKGKVKLPLQLVNLIQGQEPGLVDEGYLLPQDVMQHHPPTQVVMASQNRFVKELSSYTRAISMRLGFS